MPRSHLDIHDGSCFWPDDEGLEFSDLEAAEHETTVMAISIGRKLLRNDNERTVTVDVHDDQGQRDDDCDR